MMMIRDLLHDDLIIEEIEATDKQGVLHEFARLLHATKRIDDEEGLVRVLLEREALGSTGIGDGVAIPHAKLPLISEMIIAFGRSTQGLDYDSIDAKKTHLFFLLVTPEDNPGDHLRALARISRILKNPVLRESLKHASSRREIQRLISEEDIKYLQPQSVPLT